MSEENLDSEVRAEHAPSVVLSLSSETWLLSSNSRTRAVICSALFPLQLQAAVKLQSSDSPGNLPCNDMSGSNLSLESQGKYLFKILKLLFTHSSSRAGSQSNTVALRRSASVRSAGAVSLGGLSTSSMPAVYYSSMQEGLNTTYGWKADTTAAQRHQSHHSTLHEPLSLGLQFQDIDFLACRARVQSRQLPRDPTSHQKLQNRTDLRRTASLSSCSTAFYRSHSDSQPAREIQLVGEKTKQVGPADSDKPSSSPLSSSPPPHTPLPSPPPSPFPPLTPSPPPSPAPSPPPSLSPPLTPSPPPSPAPSPPPSPSPSPAVLADGVLVSTEEHVSECDRLNTEHHTEDSTVWPEDLSPPVITAFQSEALLDDFPSLPPPPIPITSTTLPDEPQQKNFPQLASTLSTLEKIDSLLQQTSPTERQSPLADEQPHTKESPLADEQPHTKESPLADEQPHTKESPLADEQPHTKESPLADEQPHTKESPLADEQPHTKESPLADEKRPIFSPPSLPDSNIEKDATEERRMSDTAISFDYSDMESPRLHPPPSASTSGDEFEFPPPPPLPANSTEETGANTCV